MEKILLELTTRSRKIKIKDDNGFFELYKRYEKHKTDKDDKLLNMEQF